MMVRHKTDSVYSRNAKADERLLKEQAKKLDALHGENATSGRYSGYPRAPYVIEGIVAWDRIEPPTRGFSVPKRGTQQTAKDGKGRGRKRT